MSIKVAIVGTRDCGKSTLVDNLRELSEKQDVFWVELSEYSPALEKLYNLIVIMYDVTQPQTFYQALDTALDINQLPRILIGNKADLEFRKIATKQSPVDICLHYDVPYRELSAINLTEVEELQQAIIEIAMAQAKANKCVIRISNRCYSRLKSICHWLAASSIVEGLIVVSYGVMMSLWLRDDQVWFGDSMLISGMVTFFMSFLGYYGTHYNRCKEYVNAVTPKQYLVIVLLNFMMKVAILIMAFSNSLNLHSNIGTQYAYLTDLNLVCIYCITNDSIVITFNIIERLADKSKTQSEKLNGRVGY